MIYLITFGVVFAIINSYVCCRNNAVLLFRKEVLQLIRRSSIVAVLENPDCNWRYKYELWTSGPSYCKMVFSLKQLQIENWYSESTLKNWDLLDEE